MTPVLALSERRAEAAASPACPETPPRAPRLRAAVYAAVPVAASLLVFWPVTDAYFFGDDFVHLIEVVNAGLGTVLWRPYMGHLYVVPTLVYRALWQVAGMRAGVFYGFVLVVHLVNVALFFALARILTGSARIASLGALGWGTCPLHEGTLAWFCVHGQVLATTALLLALYPLARATRSGHAVGLRSVVLSGFGLLAASTCFGTSLAVAVVFPLAAIACVGRLLGRAPRAVLVATTLSVLAVYVVAHRVYPETPGPRPLPGLQQSLADPAATLTTTADLFGVGLLGLVASFSRTSFAQPSTLGLAGAAALLAVAGAVWSPSARRRWLVGLGILAAAVYGSVAVGRAAVQVMFNQTAIFLAQTPRYHYVATVPLALMLTLAVATLASRLPVAAIVKDALCAVVVAAGLVAFCRSDWRMKLHDGARAETRAVLAEASARARFTPVGGTVTLRDRRFNPWGDLGPGILAPGFTSAGVFTLFHDSDELDGRRIRYVPDPQWSPATPPPASRLARLLGREDERPVGR